MAIGVKLGLGFNVTLQVPQMVCLYGTQTLHHEPRDFCLLVKFSLSQTQFVFRLVQIKKMTQLVGENDVKAFLTTLATNDKILFLLPKVKKNHFQTKVEKLFRH